MGKWQKELGIQERDGKMPEAVGYLGRGREKWLKWLGIQERDGKNG